VTSTAGRCFGRCLKQTPAFSGKGQVNRYNRPMKLGSPSTPENQLLIEKGSFSVSTSNQTGPRLRQDIIGHMVAAVESTNVEEHPFPHIFVRDFFPHDVYATLHKSLPHADDYDVFPNEKYGGKDGQLSRKFFQLKNKLLSRLAPAQREFWLSVRGALGSLELKKTMFGKLSSGLAYRFGCQPADAAVLPGFAAPMLYRETEAYFIKPHPDTRKKVVTMQVSLARDESQVNLGTEFYRRSLHPSSWLREPKGFQIVKTMAFLPNVAYAFVVLNTVRMKSWHGRSTLTDFSGVRNSILNAWYGSAEHVAPEMVAEQQQALQMVA